MKPALETSRKKTDYAEYGGAPLLRDKQDVYYKPWQVFTACDKKCTQGYRSKLSRKKVHKIISEEIIGFHEKEKVFVEELGLLLQGLMSLNACLPVRS